MRLMMKVAGAHRLGEVVGRSASSLAEAISSWYAEVEAAAWATDGDIRARHPRAQFADGQVCFDLGHDDHCVVVRLNYEVQAVLMTYIGPRRDAADAFQAQAATVAS